VTLSPVSPSGAAVLGTVFVALFVLQLRWPLRTIVMPALRHLFTNLALATTAAIAIRLAVIPAGIATTRWAHDYGFGLLNWLVLPNWAEIPMSFLLLDFSSYYWHRLNHRQPLLWRFHNVHHVDLDLDVSTALRFHFGEITLSTLFRVLQLAAIGASVTTFLTFETCFEAATEFHHSNWRLPFRLERLLNLVFVTPRMHGIHHSVKQRETDSNYSTIFSWWDRLNGSFRPIDEHAGVRIGVPAYHDAREQTVFRLLLLPFRKQRHYWQWPA